MIPQSCWMRNIRISGKWRFRNLRCCLIGKLSDKTLRKDIAREFCVSESTTFRWMNLTEYGKPNRLPEALSIDEFRGNADGEKIPCIPTGREAHIDSSLRQFPNRREIRCFASDMRKECIHMAKNLFPYAKIAIDRFRVVRYCTWAAESVRKRVQKSLHWDERKYFKRSRTLLRIHKEKLKEPEKETPIRILRFHRDLAGAYLFKKSSIPSRLPQAAKKRLHEFGLCAAATDLQAFEPLYKPMLDEGYLG